MVYVIAIIIQLRKQNENSLSFQCELADSNEILGDLGQSLFTLVTDEPWPVDKVLVDLFQSLCIVSVKFHLR